MRDRFRRIVIIKPSSLGDIIHALPVLHGLRTTQPDAHIAWLVSNSCAPLLEDHPELDEVIRFDRKRYGRIGRDLAVSREFMEFVDGLRGRAFDLAIDLQGLFRSGFLALASGARCRVGFAAARELAWVFYTHRVIVPDRDAHAVDRYWRFADVLGFSDVPMRWRLPIREASLAAARERRQAAGVGPGQRYAVISPGARWETKIWPADRFAGVANLLGDRYGLVSVLNGGPGEHDACEAVCRAARCSPVNLAGQTSLPELVALIAESDLVVMNDSGPIHIAAALGRPLVAIYGPTNPGRTGPYGRPDAVRRVDLPCSPCYLRRLTQCPHDHACMRRLDVGQVADAIRVVMGSDGRVVASAALASRPDLP